jgi:hypothetical protein
MDVLDRYLALPAELQWMIYNILPRCTQRAMDNKPFEGDFLDCVEQNHIGCVRHLIQTSDFNKLYYCMYDERLLNLAIFKRYSAMFKLLVEDVVKCAEPCGHGFDFKWATAEFERMKEGDEKEIFREYIEQIVEHGWHFYFYYPACSPFKRRRIN